MGKQMGKYSSPRRKPRKKWGWAVLALALVLTGAASVLLLQSRPTQREALQAAEPTIQTLPATDAASEPTVSSETPVVTPTNDKALVTCKASYTVSPGEGNPEAVVAAAGSRKLTAGMLQILYLSQIRDFQAAQQEASPDFDLPLDCQPCPLEEGLSWQHYFLKAAVLGWQAQQAALEQAQQPRIITEEGFKPDATDNLHEKNIAPGLPVNNFLYQDQDSFTPNRLHQAYLDSLEDILDGLASQAGYEGLAAMAQSLGVDAQDYLRCAQDYNTAYMLFTEESYDWDTFGLSGSQDGEAVADIRHILLIPQGAAQDENGKVTATEQQWRQAEQRAQEILDEWKSGCVRRDPDTEFARVANLYSQDEGTRLDGGRYVGLHSGDLMEPLNGWCFDSSRQAGDTAVVRSDYGCHILYLSNLQESDVTDSQNALLSQLALESWSRWLEAVPLTPDYSAIGLWVDTAKQAVSLTDTLYPDVSHERFPEAIVYFQQDYHNYPFGDRGIGLNGCGITTFAMLATYMTDTIQSPAMMSDRFTKEYFDYTSHSTDGNIFRYGPTEMGFYLDKVSTDIKEVVAALENGQVAISLQYAGHFTSKGHYLLLMHYYPEDDTIQVRDSNIYNYNHLHGHQTDRFSRGIVADAGVMYFIMQPKITAIPACTRCGHGETEPAALLTGGYICDKCAAALTRRSSFLSLLDTLSHQHNK